MTTIYEYSWTTELLKGSIVVVGGVFVLGVVSFFVIWALMWTLTFIGHLLPWPELPA